ncbi:unnamed protein product [Euphydryas editha]|uniref:Uncharacterized protein n=1 Tax=Euphydryas editha TaxID=104508 RepID=A0AAU9UXJ6_EUPED|nr:unnamed protein product [Euphydryas editha]
MCSPVLNIPSYKEPPECIPCYPIQGLGCLPCGMDNVTLRRPLIVSDSTFDYRPTSWPGMVLNNQNKKVRYQLINYEQPIKLQQSLGSLLYTQLFTAMLQQKRIVGHSLQSSSTYPVTNNLIDAILAVGQPPRPIAAFDKATIAIGHHGPTCVKTF